MLTFLTDMFKTKTPIAPPITSEASMNFDAEMVEPFLVGLMNNPRFGLPADFASFIGTALGNMALDETRKWKIDGDFDRSPVQIDVKAFMDDIDAVDLYFYSTQAAIEEIDRELTAFSDQMEG